jgi:2-polyprenyl-3-methyl-5-hydroxy-6-metoxy-1,4-benzoquinol methylase
VERDNKTRTLDDVAQWFSTVKPGVDNRLTIYSAKSLSPFFYGSRALEIGAADGQMTQILTEHFHRLVVVEGSHIYCESLRQKFGSRVEIVCTLVEEFETLEEFDTILLAHILEHLEDPVRVMLRVSRWLAHDGRVLIAVPNAHSIHRLVAVKMGILRKPDEFSVRDQELGHKRVYTLESLGAHISSAGLEVEAMGGIFFKPLTNTQMGKWFTEQMLDGFYELGKDFPEYAAEIYAVCRLPRS